MRLGNSLKHAGKNFISTSSQVCLFLDIQIGGFMYVLRVQIPSKQVFGCLGYSQTDNQWFLRGKNDFRRTIETPLGH